MDTGCGMSKELQKKVFEPFFTTKEIGKGTGLGLSMIHGIVKNHQGLIHLYSEVGAGTRFSLYFPRYFDSKEVAQNALEKKNENTKIDLRHVHIMIVEDEPVMQGLAKDILGPTYANINLAKDGKEALETYEKLSKKPDLIILDVMMPQMDGVEFFDQMIQINPKQKVLFSSGFAQSDAISNLRKKHQVKFIQKPFTADELLGKIAEFLDQPTANQTSASV